MTGRLMSQQVSKYLMIPFVSLSYTGNTGGAKQRRTAVLEQPTNISGSPPPEEHTKEDEKSATDNKEEGISEGATKNETDKTSVRQ